MKRTIGIALFLSAAAALGADRAEFRGLAMGTSKAEFREQNPLFTCAMEKDTCTLGISSPRSECSAIRLFSPNAPRDAKCVQAIQEAATYANKPASFIVRFTDDTLASVHVSFTPRDFDAIADALQQRYGAPGTARSETLRSNAGISVENRILTWVVGGDQITASKYGSRINSGYVMILSSEEYQRLKEEAATSKRTAPSNL